MSGSRAKLEQILELLLSEDTARAEELLHEYVVEKARAEYEKVLEAEDDLDTHEGEIEGEETNSMGSDANMGGDAGMGDEKVFDLDKDEGEDEEEEEEEEEGSDEADLESRVDQLADELDELRAEFEELMADEQDEPAHQHMGADMDMSKEGLGEATTFSKPAPVQPMKGATLKGSEADSSSGKSPFSQRPKATTVAGAGAPVKAHDGGEGKHTHGGSVKDHTPTDNMGIKPKKVAAPK